MQPLKNCIGPTIRIGQEILCLPYAGESYEEVHLLWGILVEDPDQKARQRMREKQGWLNVDPYLLFLLSLSMFANNY